MIREVCMGELTYTWIVPSYQRKLCKDSKAAKVQWYIITEINIPTETSI